MNRNLILISVLSLAFPVMVEAPDDSAGGSGHATRVSLGGGVGAYALIARDCEGRVVGHQPVRFREVGTEVEQQVVGPLHVGVRAGLLRDEIGPYSPGSGGAWSIQTRRYVNPYVSAEGDRVGFGLGRIISNKPLMRDPPTTSGHLRFGGRSRYISASLMESAPFYSGGGYADIGVGFHPHPRVDSWVGLGGGPFDGAGVVLKTGWNASPRWTCDLSARVGVSGGETQNAIGLGITSRFGRSSRRQGGP